MASSFTVIVTRTKNRPQLLSRAAGSVVGQAHRAFKWVIVNDGGDKSSIDQVVDLLPDWLEFKVIHLSENVGMEEAGNIGMECELASQATYVAIHDDDDVWSPRFLETMVQRLDNAPDAVGVVCNWQEVTEEAVGGGALKVRNRSVTQDPGELTISRLALRNRFPPIALVFRRSAWKKAGGFNRALPVLGDWDFNLRLLSLGNLVKVKSVLAFQHIRPKADGDESNSTVSKHDLHLQTRTAIINDYVRKDIESGRIGLGTLLATADMVEDGLNRTSLKERFSKLKTAIVKRGVDS